MARNKFGAVKVTIDGHTFDSKAEGRHYVTLKALERAGKIRNLELQPAYPITINGKRICTYKADFRFIDMGRISPEGGVGCTVVHDVKGVATPVYRLKVKLVQALYPGTVIDEIRAK